MSYEKIDTYFIEIETFMGWSTQFYFEILSEEKAGRKKCWGRWCSSRSVDWSQPSLVASCECPLLSSRPAAISDRSSQEGFCRMGKIQPHNSLNDAHFQLANYHSFFLEHYDFLPSLLFQILIIWKWTSWRRFYKLKLFSFVNFPNYKVNSILIFDFMLSTWKWKNYIML